jgi:hypothetical protein
MGFEALSDRSRRPVRYANQLAPQIESLIVGLKREKHYDLGYIDLEQKTLQPLVNPFGSRLSPMC